MGVCQYVVAACGAATPITNDSSVIAQFCFICFYIFFFASTFGPGAWVVTGELFPLKVRAKCLAATTAANWFFNWLLAYITPYLEDQDEANLGSNVFWIWGGFCWIAFLFIYFFIYETKNLTLEEVSELYGMMACTDETFHHDILIICQELRARLGRARHSGLKSRSGKQRQKGRTAVVPACASWQRTNSGGAAASCAIHTRRTASPAFRPSMLRSRSARAVPDASSFGGIGAISQPAQSEQIHDEA